MTMTIESIEEFINTLGPTSYEEWPQSPARTCAAAMTRAAAMDLEREYRTRGETPPKWGKIDPTRRLKNGRETLSLFDYRNNVYSLLFCIQAPKTEGELLTPNSINSRSSEAYDPCRFWLFPLTAAEYIGGLVLAIGVVVDGKCVALFQDPREHMELFPFQEFPNETAVKEAFARSHEVAVARWGQGVKLHHVQTEDGYYSTEEFYLRDEVTEQTISKKIHRTW